MVAILAMVVVVELCVYRMELPWFLLTASCSSIVMCLPLHDASLA